MATNLAIDDELLAEAQRLGHFETKKATVNQAFKEFIQRHKQLKIIDLFGQLDIDADYDYKAGRKQ